LTQSTAAVAVVAARAIVAADKKIFQQKEEL